MLSAPNRRVRNGVALAGLVSIVGVATPVLLPLADVYTRRGLAVAVALIVAALTLLEQRRRTLREEADADAAALRLLDDVLACFPPPRVCEANAYDLGSVPVRVQAGEPSPLPYIERDRDESLARALLEVSHVVVTGPAGAGKTRSAFEALTRVRPEARLLVPEGGDALGKLLSLVQHDPTAVLGEDRGVLWLDGLERYLDDLRIDSIDELAHRGVRVVATLRTSSLQELLQASTEAGRTARRLVTRATVVELAPTLSDVERSAATAGYPNRSFDTGMGEAFAVWPCAESALHDAAARPPAPEPTRLRNDRLGQAYMAGLALVSIFIAGLVVFDKALKPAPIADQLADARETAATCSPVDAYPPKASNDVTTYVLAVRGSRGCNSSDELRILHVDDGTLRTVYDFKPDPPSGGLYRLVCRGADLATPCAVQGAGGDQAVVAGWRDTVSNTVVPFVVQKPARGRHRATAIDRKPVVDAGAGRARTARTRYSRSMTLKSPDRPSLTGYAVADFAVVVDDDGETQVVRGFVWRGSFDAPLAIEAYAAEMTLRPDVTLTNCLFTRRSERLLFKVPRGDTGLAALLRTKWTLALRSRRGVCG